jgi:hypothetical protein
VVSSFDFSALFCETRAQVAVPSLVSRGVGRSLNDDCLSADFGELTGQPRKPRRRFDFRTRSKRPSRC